MKEVNLLNPEAKAWQYFKELLGDDEKYFTLKTKKEPISVDGSDGGKYFLYPNGNLARIDKDRPLIGRILFGKQMPLPDFLTTILVWITKNEHVLKQKWKCGTLSIYYNEGEATYEDGIQLERLQDGNVFLTGIYFRS